MTVTAASKLFASPTSIIAIGRQVAQGSPRLANLYKLVEMQVTPKHDSNMSDRGIEVGSNSITQRRSQKESFMPEVDISGHLTVGAAQNLRLMNGYMPLTEGTDPGSPIATTLSAAITTRHQKYAALTDVTGLVVGDWLQIGALTTPGSPVQADKVEVHEIVSIGATSAVQVIKLWATGGTFTVSFGGQTTSALAYNITGPNLQTALRGLSSIGASNINVSAISGSGTYADPYVWTCTFAGSLASLNQAVMTVDGSSLTPVATTTARGSGVYVRETVVGCAASQVAFKGGVLYTYATATAVKKVDNAKACTTYELHIQPDNLLDGDLYTIYYRIANPDITIEGILYDVAAGGINPSFQTGSIATVSSQAKALIVDRTPGKMESIYATLIADPSDVTVNNTRGSFSLLSNTYDAPQSINFQEAAELYDDVVLTKYYKQSNVHIGFTITASTGGKFVKDFFDQIIFNGASSYTVSDVIPEAALNFTALSSHSISTGVYYEQSLVAPNCQFAGYNPELSTNQPVMGNIELCKIVVNESTGAEAWYWKAVNTCTSDVYSANY